MSGETACRSLAPDADRRPQWSGIYLEGFAERTVRRRAGEGQPGANPKETRERQNAKQQQIIDTLQNLENDY